MTANPCARLLALALSASCVGCAPDSGRTQYAPKTVRDSSGIQLTSYSDVPKEPTRFLRVESNAYLEFGALDGPREVDAGVHEASVAVLSDGTIVLGGASRLRYFTPRGDSIRAVGGRGWGPGEFSQVGTLCALDGDSLLVFDAGDGRLSLWDQHGNHVATHPRRGFAVPSGCTRHGGVLVADRSVAGTERDHRGALLDLYAVRSVDGTLHVDLGLLPSSRYENPILSSPSIAFLGDDELVVATPRRYEIEIRSLGGAVRRILRVETPLRVFTSGDWDSVVDNIVKWNPPSRQPALRARAMAMRRPTHFPAFGEVRVDPRRRIWVSDLQSRQVWTVFEHDGAFVDRVRLPKRGPAGRSDLVALGKDWLAMQWRDEDGALHVDFHRLVERAR